MVGADKRFAIAFLIGAKLIAPVRTLVQKKPDIPFPIADHDDGRGTHAFGHVVVLFRNFTFVTDIDPGSIPYLFHLPCEDGRIGIEAAVDPRGFDQRSEEHMSELPSLMRYSYAVLRL